MPSGGTHILLVTAAALLIFGCLTVKALHVRRLPTVPHYRVAEGLILVAVVVLGLLPVHGLAPAIGVDRRTLGGRGPSANPAHLLGWYSSANETARLALYRSTSANTVVVGYESSSTLRRYLAEAQARHVWVFLQPNPDWIVHADWKNLEAFIREFQQSPILYAWYLYDEPDHAGLSPILLRKAYRLIRQLDSHPIGVVFMSGMCRLGADALDPRYANGFDILMFDYYPFWAHDNSRDDLRRVDIVDRNCRATSRALHKPFILVLQGFGQGVVEDGVHWRDPTPRELRYAYSHALLSGARGVLFYADYQADPVTESHVFALLRGNGGKLPVSPALRPGHS